MLAACRGAAAAPAAAELGVPASWIELPKVAETMRGAHVTAAAWGDPSAGCYLVAASARGAKEDAEDARHALASGLGLPVGSPIDGEIKEAGLRGKVRGWSEPAGEDDVVSTAVACVYNDREPAACAAACDAVWAKLTHPPVIP
ncbi:MAG TPA: hypothetical protein VL463_04520 [Kofleriaceae bacterium]|nr:hypothetical protein [Kofleriaceae bacterium]